jgi:antitoxin component YwqK of YwqJK toxin-antitoxin module
MKPRRTVQTLNGKMIKNILAILISTFILSFFTTYACAELITVQFSKNKNMASGHMIYHLVFKRGDDIVAKRSYENGKAILEEGKIPDGMVVENYPSGKAKNIMFYENGERNGPAISLYESGRVKSQAFYKNGNTTGKGFYYFENGAVMTEWEIVNGKELYHYEYTESGKRGRYRTADGKDVTD